MLLRFSNSKFFNKMKTMSSQWHLGARVKFTNDTAELEQKIQHYTKEIDQTVPMTPWRLIKRFLWHRGDWVKGPNDTSAPEGPTQWHRGVIYVSAGSDKTILTSHTETIKLSVLSMKNNLVHISGYLNLQCFRNTYALKQKTIQILIKQRK